MIFSRPGQPATCGRDPLPARRIQRKDEFLRAGWPFSLRRI